MTPLVFYYHNSVLLPSFQIIQALIRKRTPHVLTGEYNEFLIDVYLLLDNPASNVIVFDWDNTFPVDPDFYNCLIEEYIKVGFRPIICTLREFDASNIAEMQRILKNQEIMIYFSDGRSKQDYLSKEKGISVNLWIDDYFPAICRFGCALLRENKINF